MSLDEVKAKLAKAEKSRQAGELYLKFLSNRTPEELRKLQHDEHLEIAIHACWELNDRKILRKEDPELNPQIAEPKHAARFLGFLEARTRLQIPEWWESTIFDPTYGGFDQKQDQALREYYRKTYEDREPPAGKRWRDIRLPPDTFLDRKGDTAIARVGSKTAVLPAALFDAPPDDFDWEFCSIDIADDSTIVALYQKLPGPYPLICVDAKTGNVRWRRDTWSAGINNLSFGGFSGSHHHDIQIQRTNDTVALFGDTSFGSYLEIYDIKTGKMHFAFSPTYWQLEPPWRNGPQDKRPKGKVQK
ncbi:MAG: hypothetical protein WD648_09125 [Planctomycetaceae bacterium]